MIWILIQQRTPVQTITPRINIIFMIIFSKSTKWFRHHCVIRQR